MLVNITTKCSCGRRLAPIEAGESATFHATRQCPKCHARWAVIVRPLPTQRADRLVHRVELTCIADARPRCSGCSGYHGTEIVCPNRPESDGSELTEFDGPIPGYDEA